MKIDVIMITKNSSKPCLVSSLESIKKNINLNKIVIVDSFSIDNTIEILKDSLNGLLDITQKNCSRGKARELAIKKVETEWFAFVDSDVILEENWQNIIEKNITSKIGAIEGNVKSKEGIPQKIRQNGRGYTNCTLIKSSLVEDIVIPEEMKVYEDQFIRRFIEKKGYAWLKVATPCSLHLSTSDRFKDAYEIGKMSGKYHLDSFWKFILSFFIVSLKWVVGGKEPPTISYKIVTGFINGYFSNLTHYSKSMVVSK